MRDYVKIVKVANGYVCEIRSDEFDGPDSIHIFHHFDDVGDFCADYFKESAMKNRHHDELMAQIDDLRSDSEDYLNSIKSIEAQARQDMRDLKEKLEVIRARIEGQEWGYAAQHIDEAIKMAVNKAAQIKMTFT